MSTYAITGSASGMGKAVADHLRAEGHRVIGVDIAQGDVVADLSNTAGRRAAVAAILEASGGSLDGVILAAGVGPIPGKDKPPLIMQVNYLGVVEVLEGLRPALARADRAKVVVFSSNSTTTMPAVPGRAIRALLRHDVDAAVRATRLFGKNASAMAYGASKIAVTRWMRRAAVTREWAGAGIRMNAIAPGAILTPLLEKQLATPSEANAVTSFPVPVGGYGDPAQLGTWVAFMTSDAADFMCGSVVYVDGGSDAWFRADDWPRAVPARRVPWYLRRMKAFRAH